MQHSNGDWIGSRCYDSYRTHYTYVHMNTCSIFSDPCIGRSRETYANEASRKKPLLSLLGLYGLHDGLLQGASLESRCVVPSTSGRYVCKTYFLLWMPLDDGAPEATPTDEPIAVVLEGGGYRIILGVFPSVRRKPSSSSLICFNCVHLLKIANSSL